MSCKSAEELCLIALKFDAKCEGKLSCTFKNDMKNLANFHRLENSDFILDSKMAEIKIKIQNKQIDEMLCENFILPWK